MFLPPVWSQVIFINCSVLAGLNKWVFEPAVSIKKNTKPTWIAKFYLKQIWIHGWTPNTGVPAHGKMMVLDPTGAGWCWSMKEFCTKVLAAEQVVGLQSHQNTDFVNTNNHQHEQLGDSNSLPLTLDVFGSLSLQLKNADKIQDNVKI